MKKQKIIKEVKDNFYSIGREIREVKKLYNIDDFEKSIKSYKPTKLFYSKSHNNNPYCVIKYLPNGKITCSIQGKNVTTKSKQISIERLYIELIALGLEYFYFYHQPETKAKEYCGEIPIVIGHNNYEDEFIPKDKTQELYIYVNADECDISVDMQKTYLQKLFDYMNTKLEFNGVKMELIYEDAKMKNPLIKQKYLYIIFNGWKIKTENMTHLRRSILIKELNKARLSFDTIPFKIYSES
jgi:hypothetical protein